MIRLVGVLDLSFGNFLTMRGFARMGDLEKINTTGYLIADLTLGNKNVYLELGFKMGTNKENFLLIHNEGVDGAKFDKDISFNVKGFRVIKAEDSNYLRTEVEKQLKEHYGAS